MTKFKRANLFERLFVLSLAMDQINHFECSLKEEVESLFCECTGFFESSRVATDGDTSV